MKCGDMFASFETSSMGPFGIEFSKQVHGGRRIEERRWSAVRSS